MLGHLQHTFTRFRTGVEQREAKSVGEHSASRPSVGTYIDFPKLVLKTFTRPYRGAIAQLLKGQNISDKVPCQSYLGEFRAKLLDRGFHRCPSLREGLGFHILLSFKAFPVWLNMLDDASKIPRNKAVRLCLRVGQDTSFNFSNPSQFW